MAKEDMDLDDILKQTEAPKRANGKEKPKTKIAKLTRRTIDSLKGKIKNGRLSYAFWRYNSNYKKMVRDLNDAKEVLQEQAAGKKVSDAKVETAFEIVASHNRRLAKHGARLLEYDIKEIAQKEKTKKIKIPGWIRGKFRTITRTVLDATFQKVKDKKVQRKVEKEIKDATKVYIDNSVEGAFFKGGVDGELRSNIDVQTLRNLTPDKNAETIDDKMANLRKFISIDGKTPLYTEEEIGIKGKTGTDVPPVAPEATVVREEKKVSEEQLLSGLGKKTVPEEDLNEKTETSTEKNAEPEKDTKVSRTVTMDDILKGVKRNSAPVVENVPEKNLNEKTETLPEKNTEPEPVVESVPETSEVAKDETVEQPVEQKEAPVVDELSSARKREIATITALGKLRDVLYEQLAETSDVEVANSIREYIDAIEIEIKDVISSGIVSERNKDINAKKEKINSDEKGNVDVDSVKIAKAVEDPTKEYVHIELKNARPRQSEGSLEPIEVKPDEKKVSSAMSNVHFTEPQLTRVSQASNPAVLRVTPEDIRKLEERNVALERRISDLTKEKEELLAQKTLFEKAIELGKEADARMLTVEKLTEDTTGLKGEVDELGAQAAPYISRLGK